jgi:hypothetical protein
MSYVSHIRLDFHASKWAQISQSARLARRYFADMFSIVVFTDTYILGSGLREGSIAKPIAIPKKKTLSGIGKDRDEAFPFWEQYGMQFLLTHSYLILSSQFVYCCLQDHQDSY